MKLFWQSSLMFSSFALLPGATVFFIYSIGAMILLAQWQLFLWGIAALFAAIVTQSVVAILSEL